jgi:hypothetical protein
MTPRDLLDALAGSTVYVNGAEYSADMIEPKTFDALRAVLDKCDEHEHGATRWENPLPVPSWIAEFRTAIASALEGS